MLRQSIIILSALFTLGVNANPNYEDNPITDYVNAQIETLELELELFGTVMNTDIASIESIQVYEIEEELTLDFDTSNYLPADFNAFEGMVTLDWTEIDLYELEEEENFDFNVQDYLPEGFDPYEGMNKTELDQGICYF